MKKNKIKLLIIGVLILIKMTELKSYMWPVSPKDNQHKITSVIGECRKDRNHFHSGIDIGKSYNIAVYAIESGEIPLNYPKKPIYYWVNGQKKSKYNGRIRIGRFEYWHTYNFYRNQLNIEIEAGDIIDTGEQICEIEWHHLHLIEYENENSNIKLNPLRAGGITPFAINFKPEIKKIGFIKEIDRDTYVEFEANIDSKPVPWGKVDIYARAEQERINQDGNSLGIGNMGIYKIGADIFWDTKQIETSWSFETDTDYIEYDDVSKAIKEGINNIIFDTVPDNAFIKYAYLKGSGNETHTYILTNKISGDINKADGFWSSNEHLINNDTDSLFQESSRFPDGPYKIRIKAGDIRNNVDVAETTFIVDNYIPIIKELGFNFGSYAFFWEYKGGQSYQYREHIDPLLEKDGKYLMGNDNLPVGIVGFNEPMDMKRLRYIIDGINIADTLLSTSDYGTYMNYSTYNNQFEAEFNQIFEFQTDEILWNKEMGEHSVSIGAYDLAGNTIAINPSELPVNRNNLGQRDNYTNGDISFDFFIDTEKPNIELDFSNRKFKMRDKGPEDFLQGVQVMHFAYYARLYKNNVYQTSYGEHKDFIVSNGPNYYKEYVFNIPWDVEKSGNKTFINYVVLDQAYNKDDKNFTYTGSQTYAPNFAAPDNTEQINKKEYVFNGIMEKYLVYLKNDIYKEMLENIFMNMDINVKIITNIEDISREKEINNFIFIGDELKKEQLRKINKAIKENAQLTNNNFKIIIFNCINLFKILSPNTPISKIIRASDIEIKYEIDNQTKNFNFLKKNNIVIEEENDNVKIVGIGTYENNKYGAMLLENNSKMKILYCGFNLLNMNILNDNKLSNILYDMINIIEGQKEPKEYFDIKKAAIFTDQPELFASDIEKSGGCIIDRITGTDNYVEIKDKIRDLRDYFLELKIGRIIVNEYYKTK